MYTYTRKDLLADVLVVGIACGLAWGAYIVCKPPLVKLWGILKTASGGGALPEGTAVNYNWKIQTLEGKEVQVFDLKNKVIFVNFWATWCGPCKLEMPSIEKLHKQFDAREVVFLIVSAESIPDLTKYQETTRTGLPLYHVDKIPASFKVLGLPTTYILSRSGKVAHAAVGARQWDKKKYVQLLEKLLAESSSAAPVPGA